MANCGVQDAAAKLPEVQQVFLEFCCARPDSFKRADLQARVKGRPCTARIKRRLAPRKEKQAVNKMTAICTIFLIRQVVKIEVKTSNNYNLTEGANVVLAFKNVRLISIYHLQRENHGSRKFETTYNLNGRSACTDRPQPPGSCSGLPECSSGLKCISLHIVRENYCVINCTTD